MLTESEKYSLDNTVINQFLSCVMCMDVDVDDKQ